MSKYSQKTSHLKATAVTGMECAAKQSFLQTEALVFYFSIGHWNLKQRKLVLLFGPFRNWYLQSVQLGTISASHVLWTQAKRQRQPWHVLLLQVSSALL